MKNEPAYPIVESISDHISSTGITKRELFAAMAMQGVLSADIQAGIDWVVELSARYADALIKELEK